MTRYQKRRSRIEQRKFRRNVMVHFIIILLIMAVAICMVVRACVKDESTVQEEHDYHLVAGSMSAKPESLTVTELVHEQEKEETNETTEEIVDEPEPEPEFLEFTYGKDWSGEDSYLLAKIAMAEAEGCDTYTKTLVILTVLNRVNSSQFPDTIEEVLFQNRNGVYQFSPCRPNGRWWRVEPNEDCYLAVQMVSEARYDYSQDCMYFESCEDEDNWHNRNLEFLFKSGGIRFYR